MEAMDDISRAFEWIGVAIIVVAFIVACAEGVRQARGGVRPLETYLRVREVFGRGILLGLEVLIAADLIRTVAVEPTTENVIVLGLIVLVRTILSFSLDVEIDGVLPWRKSKPGSTG